MEAFAASMNYEQLCGALGLLKQSGAEMEWGTVDDMLRHFAARLGAGDGSVHDEIDVALRAHRDECLRLGLIRRGELFGRDDMIPIVP